jgi:hypothetical protein
MNPAYLEMCRTDVERAVGEARAASALGRASRARLERLQQQRLDALVRHAVARSPLYRERLGSLVGPGPVDLQTLPTLDKATLVARFDDSVCDERLRLDDLLEHLDGLDHDALYLDEFPRAGHERLVRPQGSVRLRPAPAGPPTSRSSCASSPRPAIRRGATAASAWPAWSGAPRRTRARG